MKNIFITILLLIVSVVGYSQFAPIVPMGSPSTENRATGALGTLTGMVYDKNWSDTGAANANLFVKNTPGIVIRVADVEFWVRNQTVNLWTKISGSGGGGFTTGDNGLTASSATNLQWGGSLLQNTSIISTAFTETHAYTNMGANAGFNLTQTGTASGSTNTLFKATQSGATGIGQTTYTMDLYNLRTGTGGSNVTLRLNNTGKTSRFSLLVPTGFVSIGDEVIPVSKLDLVVAGLGATPHDTASFQIYNTTLATAAVPVQVSPSVWLYGNAWDSNGLVSKTPTFKFWSIPESRSGNVRGSLRFFYNPNATFGGFDTAVLSINSKGGIGLGINSNYGTANQVLVSGGATGEASWINQSSIVGAVPTLQQVLDAGSVLTTGDNTITSPSGAFLILKSQTTGGGLDVWSGTTSVFRQNDQTLFMPTLTYVNYDTTTYVSIVAAKSGGRLFQMRGNPSAGSGTVTSVATGYGLSGGTITTTGTLIGDSTKFPDKTRPNVWSGVQDFTARSVYGGVSSSFPSLINSNADLALQLADGSAYTNLIAAGIKSGSTTFNLATTNATLINIGGGNGAVSAFSGGTSSGKIRILEPNAIGGNYMEWSVPALAGNVSNVWPNANGSGVLTNDGSGNLSWAPIATDYWNAGGTTNLSSNPVTIEMGDKTLTFHGSDPAAAFVVDGANLGINVLVPTVALDLAGISHFTTDGVLGEAPIQAFFNSGNSSRIIKMVDNAFPGSVTFEGNFTSVHSQVIQDADGTIMLTGAANPGSLQLSSYTAGAATFDGSGNITSVSDRRAKHDIKSFTYGLDAVLKLNPATFIYNQDKSNTVMSGFIAQDVRKAIPIAVHEGKIDPKTGQPGMMSLETNAILAAQTNAIQELYSIIQEQQREIEYLKTKIK